MTEQSWTIPPSWAWAKVDDVGRVVSGGTPSTKEASYWGREIVWFSPADLTGYKAKYIERGAKFLSRKGLENSSAQLIPKGTVMFSSRAPIGYVAITSVEAATNQGFKSIVPSDGVFNEYLYYYLKAAKHIAEERATGTTFKEISGSTFAKLPVPVAPTNEQRRIVAKIEELFSELDKGIESLTTAREQLKVYRLLTLRRAFEGYLTADWRNQNQNEENGSSLKDHILRRRREEWEQAELTRLSQTGAKPKNNAWKKRYPEPDCFDEVGLPELPTAWCWAGLDEIVSGKPRSMQSGPFGSNLLHSEFQATGVLVLGIDNVRDGTFSMGSENRISQQKYHELKKYTARPGDLLITVMASLGRTCVVPRDLERAIITKHVYRVTTEPEFIVPEFFNLLLQGPTTSRARMFKNAQGQTRPGLNGGILKALPIPICSRAEQLEIVSRLSSLLSQVDQALATIDEQLAKTTALRQSILRQAFSGRLVPQDANDEHASVLLERIRSAQDEGSTKKRCSSKIDHKEAA